MFVVFIAFVFIKILNKNRTPHLKEVPFSNIKPSSHSQISEKNHCIHHQNNTSVGSCLICEEVFCENCLVDHESMHFCREHFRVFASNTWRQITDLRTTPDTPEEGLFIYHFKKDLWLKKSIPSFVMTHYKINIENDFIESFVQLNVRESDAEKLSFMMVDCCAIHHHPASTYL